MEEKRFKKYEPIFGHWYIKQQLGEGGYGEVYEIERTDFGVTYRAALKAITIPRSDSERKSIMSEGLSENQATDYFREVVSDMSREFALMDRLKGNSYIVSYEDHAVYEHEDGIGWDILIRMELLTPLVTYLDTHTMTETDIIRFGIDLCKALELCGRQKIIHRDIKPQNIFYSDSGTFKLGDFGVARIAERTTGASTRVGTQGFTAPEIYSGSRYTGQVDLYSLGLVMYRMLNDNRLPFMPPAPEPITFAAKEAAQAKRISGTPFPPPANASAGLSAVVLKACAFRPQDRYVDAVQMRMALERLLPPEQTVQEVKDAEDPTELLFHHTPQTPAQAATDASHGMQTPPPYEQNAYQAPPSRQMQMSQELQQQLPPALQQQKPTGKKWILLGVGIGTAIVAVVALVLMLLMRGDDGGATSAANTASAPVSRDTQTAVGEASSQAAVEKIVKEEKIPVKDESEWRYGHGMLVWTKGKTALYDAPDTDASVLHQIPAGEELRVILDEGERWVKAEYKGTAGYLSYNDVEVSGSMLLFEMKAEGDAAVLKDYGSKEVLHEIRQGDTVYIFEETERDGKEWYRVEIPGEDQTGVVEASQIKPAPEVTVVRPAGNQFKTGWFSSASWALGNGSMVKATKEYRVYADPSEDAEIVPIGYAGDNDEYLAFAFSDHGWIAVVDYRTMSYGFVQEDAFREQRFFPAEIAVLRNGAKVYRGRGKDTGEIFTATGEYKAYAFGFFSDAGGGWYLVETPSGYGYVWTDDVRIQDVPKEVRGSLLITKKVVYVREGVGTDTKQLGAVKRGEMFAVTGGAYDNEGVIWYQVRYKNKTGYIQGQLVHFIRQID